MTDVKFTRIEEHPVEGKRLGWHKKEDPRSANFPAEKVPQIVDVLHKAGGAGWFPLDQGNLGSCTANGLVGGRMVGPNISGRGRFYEKDARWLYGNEEVEMGYSRDADNGGTGIDVCKVAVAAKWISSYTHTFNLDDALAALGVRPGLMGTNWDEGFDSPDANGVVHKAGQVRGGHMFIVVQVLTAAKLVGCWNSWGLGYGVASPDGTAPGGYFYMPFDVVGEMIGEGADFTFPVR